MATRGHLGGMALAAPEAIRILDASGKDLVIVETVGVGQAEVEIASAADTTLVVVAPGWGDAVQVAKAGILEIADVFVVNKADRDGADAAVRDIQGMIALGTRLPGEWRPAVVRSVAARGEGIDDVVAAIAKHRDYLSSSDRLVSRRRLRARAEIEAIALASLRARIGLLDHGAALPGLACEVAAGTLDPYAAAARLTASV
jgi:LAO/AO transport system kinase